MFFSAEHSIGASARPAHVHRIAEEEVHGPLRVGRLGLGGWSPGTKIVKQRWAWVKLNDPRFTHSSTYPKLLNKGWTLTENKTNQVCAGSCLVTSPVSYVQGDDITNRKFLSQVLFVMPKLILLSTARGLNVQPSFKDFAPITTTSYSLIPQPCQNQTTAALSYSRLFIWLKNQVGRSYIATSIDPSAIQGKIQTFLKTLVAKSQKM